MKEVFTSSKSCEWSTPQELFDWLDQTHHFTLDPASTDENAKCEKHYTLEDNGLSKDWGGERVFLNPPYGKEIGLWVKKAYEESLKPNTLVCCLLPARTDTRWFHDYCNRYGVVSFIRGRIKFGGSKENAPFPSMIVLFGW